MRPIIMLKTTAPTNRATPSSKPKIRAVRIIAKIFIAGPEYKKATAAEKQQYINNTIAQYQRAILKVISLE